MKTNPTLQNARKIIKNHKNATLKMDAERYHVNSGDHKMEINIGITTEIIINKMKHYLKKIKLYEDRRLSVSRTKVWHQADGEAQKQSLMAFAIWRIETLTTKLSRWVAKYSKLYTIALRREEIDIPYLIAQAKKVSIRRVLANHGIEPNQQKKIKCINPQHDDGSPSMHVYEDRVHCFSCGENYDAIEVEKVLSRDTFITVIKRLAN